MGLKKTAEPIIMGTYTPSWVAASGGTSIGNGSITGTYIKIGKMVTVTVNMEMGSTTTFGTGSYYWTLPFNIAAGKTATGACWALDAGTAYKSGVVRNETNSDAVADRVYCFLGGSAGGEYSPTVPHTWAANDDFGFTITYEAVS